MTARRVASHVYIFTAPKRCGPWRRVFTSVIAFDGYIAEFRKHGSVEWLSPFVARGAF